MPAAARGRSGLPPDRGSYRLFVSWGDVGTSFNGWNSSIAVNSNRNFGLVGDFSGHYTRYTQLHTILGGPRFTFRGNERVHPFVHALVGGGVLTEDGSWDSAFAWAVGAGADVKVSKNVAIRVIEVNYLQYRANDVVSHNGRIATGGVWRFGSNN